MGGGSPLLIPRGLEERPRKGSLFRFGLSLSKGSFLIYPVSAHYKQHMPVAGALQREPMAQA